ncbi:MAG: phenylacetate--CoA ligase family protein [Pseudonocardia sp.]
MTPYEELRAKQVADLGAQVPGMLDRLTWPADRLAAHRTTELRRLLRVAREASPWHRERLAGIDIDVIDESDLSALPVMTKDDLMAHFDTAVTDERLTLHAVEEHLADLTGDGYLFDRYLVAASGGSSGRRGLFVYDWDATVTLFLSGMRQQIRAQQVHPALAGMPPVTAFVGGATPHHMSAIMPRRFSRPDNVIHRFPVSLPIEEIVAGLNETQPSLLWGYPSVMHALAVEGSVGRLRIAPRWVVTFAEPLLPETRAALEAVFGVAVGNSYVASEGGIATPCRAGAWPHLNDDLLILEPVDEAGRPVPPGTRCAKLYLTNLFNHAQPLIRYELTDQIELVAADEPCACGCAHRRITDPYGRLDDVFTYGDRTVHPYVFASPLSRHRAIVEYQVRQAVAGATISVVTCAPCDTAALAGEIRAALTQAGLSDPRVDVEMVERLPRPPSGKLRRFVPLDRR